MAPPRSRKPAAIADHVHGILAESGPRNMNVVRAMVARPLGNLRVQPTLERVIGILFLDGRVKWQGRKRGRRLAAA